MFAAQSSGFQAEELSPSIDSARSILRRGNPLPVRPRYGNSYTPIWGWSGPVKGVILLSMHRKGLSLLELLIVMAVLAIVFAIAATTLFGSRRQLNLEQAVQTLVQDIQTCRTNALSWGDACRVHFIGAGYTIERRSGAGYTSWQSRSLPAPMTLTNIAPDAWLEFDPRSLLSMSPGFPTVGGVVAPEIRLSNGSKTYRTIVSMVGAVKILPL